MVSRLTLLWARMVPDHKYLVQEIRLLARSTVIANHLEVTDHVVTVALEEVGLGPKEVVDKLRRSPFPFRIDAPEDIARRFKRLYLDLVFEDLSTGDYSEHVEVMLHYHRAGKSPYIAGIAHLVS